MDDTFKKLMDPIYGVNNELAFRYLLIRNVEEDNKLKRKFDFSIWERRSLEHVFPKSKVVHYINNQWKDGNDKEVDLHDITPEDFTEDNNGIFDDYLGRHIISEFKDQALGDIEITEHSMGNEITEHSMGNLLLLYGRNNSQHKDKDVERKRREDFFDPQKPLFESRNLLHSVLNFARDDNFGAEQIARNQLEIFEDLDRRTKIIGDLKDE